MGDNVNITPGSGENIAADEVTINGTLVKTQRIKIALGTDGNYQADLATGQATKANSLPVTLASDQDASLVDDAAFTAATSRVLPIGATYQATADEVNDGDIGAPRMTIRRGMLNASDFVRVTVANAQTIRDTAQHNYTLSTASGFTESTIASFRRWRVFILSTHDQPAILLMIVPTYTSGSKAFDQGGQDSLIHGQAIAAGTTKLTYQSEAVTGYGSQMKQAPGLTSISDLQFQIIPTGSAPTTGSITIVMEGYT